MGQLTTYRGHLTESSEQLGERLVEAFLAGLSAHTQRAYQEDLDVFADAIGQPDRNTALLYLMGLPPGQANGVLLDFRAGMKDRGLAPATINRRLSAIRSAMRLARTLGMTQWVPEIEGLKVQAFRDTAGPGLDGVQKLLSGARAQSEASSVKALRDEALISLMFDMGLRRGEVAALDLEDLLRDSKRLLVKGKGKAQKQPFTVPEPTLEALQAWLGVRSEVALSGERAIFVGLGGGRQGRRITGRGLHFLIQGLGRRVGIVTRPHGLRHAAVTDVLEATNGNIETAQKFARHASPQTTMAYNDNRKDAAGEAARLIAARRLARAPA